MDRWLLFLLWVLQHQQTKPRVLFCISLTAVTKKLEEGWAYFGSQFEDTLNHGGEG